MTEDELKVIEERIYAWVPCIRIDTSADHTTSVQRGIRIDVKALCAEVRRLQAALAKASEPTAVHVRDEVVEQHKPGGSLGIITGSGHSRAVTKAEVEYLTAADVKDNK